LLRPRGVSNGTANTTLHYTRRCDSFRGALEQRGDVKFVAWSSPNAAPKILDTSTGRNEHGFRSHCYLVRPQDIAKLRFKRVPGQDYWLLDSELSALVMEFNGGFFDGTLLRRGRLFYETGYYDSSGAWVAKPEDFIKWSESITRLAKRLLQHDAVFDAYFGDSAREWLATTAGELDI